MSRKDTTFWHHDSSISYVVVIMMENNSARIRHLIDGVCFDILILIKYSNWHSNVRQQREQFLVNDNGLIALPALCMNDSVYLLFGVVNLLTFHICNHRIHSKPEKSDRFCIARTL